MHPFRKKPPSSATPTPPVPEQTKQRPAKSRPRGKGRKVLAASSSAITPEPITSPSYDPTDHTLDESGSSKESAWKAAYGAARMAVEITNASSDMFLPLKAVVGALSVLIKNYDQTVANGDQIREVERRIQSLSGILAHPVGEHDSEEKTRREGLKKKLAGIVAKLGPLAEQHILVKFLKNVDNTEILNGFVQDLAYAVTDYQTSLQQSIHKNTDIIDKATQRINETTNRIDQTANKIDETTDRIDGTTNRVDKTTERIDDTTKKIDQSARHLIEAADLELLGKLEPVRNAGYQAGHHDTCLRGTRESVLDGIMRWAKDQDPQDRHVFWLNGLAGTGKSTIAQTFSGMVAKAGILGASFFCSRDYLDRRELKNIFPTLAYQLACRYPTFRCHIIQAIKQDPTVASNSLISQLEDLIVGPLSSSKISCVIVVDALDECIDDQPASAILSVLGRHVKQLSFVKFFVTGRPEPRIRTGFRLPLLEPLTQIFLLHEVKLSDVDGDIKLYLQDKLTAVSKQRSDLDLSDPWPCDQDLATLTKKSSGLFIFASTLIRFITSEHHEPDERLQLVITSSDSTVHEGRAGIDSLYTQILEHAFLDVKETTVFANLRRVLGAVVLAFNPLSRIQIAGILGVKTSLVTRSLRHLHSVLSVPNEDSKEIRVFHKSFPDFLQDLDRCSNPNFFIDPHAHHGDIAFDCLELLKKLKSNPCDLPDFVMNRDVADLPKLLEDRVGSATRYACGYWAMHVRSSPSPTTHNYAIRLIPSATGFFEKNAVPWIEVMSLENRLESVIHGIYGLFDWLGEVHVPTSDLRSRAQDCLRFTMHFFHPIQQSASHVYHSALPLSPKSSRLNPDTVRKRTRITDFCGRPGAWGILVRTIAASSKRLIYLTTFGHRIAAAYDDGTAGIFDSVTGVLRLSLSPVDPVQAIGGSPEGSTLFCAHRTLSVTAWDIQTGGLIHTFVLERNPEDIAISLKGHYLACGSPGGRVEVLDVANETGTKGAAIWNSSPAVRFCWLEPEEQLAVSKKASVAIWDIATATILHSLVMQYPVHCMVYSQKFNQLAILASLALESVVTTLNPQAGTPTLSHLIRPSVSCIAFSQVIEELVCGVEGHELRLFNVPTRRWKHIEYPDKMTSVSSLPNGTVAANFAGSGLQLLNLDDGDTASRQPTTLALTIHPLCKGRAFAVLSAGRDRIMLFESTSVSCFLTIRVQKSHTIPTDRIPIIFASLDKVMAVYYFKEREKAYMQLLKAHDKRPAWTVGIGGLPLVGGISPSGTWLVTYEAGHTSLWDARNGRLQERLPFYHADPFDITFSSETRFCVHGSDYRIEYLIDPEKSQDKFSPCDIHRTPSPPKPPCYELDETREWVVSDSKRICWIPPVYIRSVQSSYYWVGCSLIMAGQDGILRKLTFREPI